MPPQFEYAHHQRARFTRHRWTGLFCPVLKGLCIGQGPLRRFQSDFLVRKVVWQEHTPFEAFWCRGHSVLLMVPEGLTSDSWNLEGCMKFPSQLLRTTYIWYGSQLLPLVGNIQLAGPLFQPHLVVMN